MTIAVALLALGAVFLVLGVAAAIIRWIQRARDERTMRSGILTTAVVSNDGYDFFRESPAF